MPKVTQVYENVVHVRRSKRHGLRRTHRRSRRTKRDRKLDRRKTVYDRDHGGVKTRNHKWVRTKRELLQVYKETQLVGKLRKKAAKVTQSGYAENDFVVADDANIEENAFTFDTDEMLDRADAIELGTDSESDNPPDFLCSSSSDDSDLPEGEA